MKLIIFIHILMTKRNRMVPPNFKSSGKYNLTIGREESWNYLGKYIDDDLTILAMQLIKK